jgi:hypothetical protein
MEESTMNVVRMGRQEKSLQHEFHLEDREREREREREMPPREVCVRLAILWQNFLLVV